jgi:hypothetical protein
LKRSGYFSRTTPTGWRSDLRNQAAHFSNVKIEPGQALEYAQLARKVIAALKDAPAQPG